MLSVTEEPEILALTAIAPLVPACKVKAPVAVMPSLLSNSDIAGAAVCIGQTKYCPS